jgi:hypothetical protein
VVKGVDIEMAPLDEDHVRAKITWSEQDLGGGKLVVEVCKDLAPTPENCRRKGIFRNEGTLCAFPTERPNLRGEAP